jgi:hypothetical protein
VAFNVGEIFATAGLKVDQTGFRQWDKATKSAERDGERLTRMGGRAQAGIGKAAKAAAGLAAGYASIAGAKDAVNVTTELAKATIGLSKNLGMSTKDASAWAAVARARNVDAKALNMSFGKLSREIVAANEGTQKQREELDRLGTSQKDQERRQALIAAGAGAQAEAFDKLGVSQEALRSGDFNRVLAEISDGLEKMGPGAERTALSMRLFGRGWQTIVPVLRGGSKEMREQLALAEKYGVTFGGKSVKSMEDLIKAQREAKFATMGLQVAFGTQLAPELTKIIGKVSGFVRGMREGKGAGGKFAETARDISGAVSSVVRWLGRAGANVVAFIEDVRDGSKQTGSFGKKMHDFGETVLTVWRSVKKASGDTISFMLRRYDDFLGVVTTTSRAFEWIPGVGGKMRELRKKVDEARESIRGAADRIDAMGESADGATGRTGRLGRALAGIKPPKPVKVRVGLDVFIPGGSSLGKMPGQGDGWGVEAGMAALGAGIQPAADALVPQAAKAGMFGKLIPQVAGSGLNAFNGLAQRFGVGIGSGVRPGSITSSGNLSWHARGRARDFPGSAPNMMAFAKFLASVYGSKLLELIYTPLGFSIKNGQRVAPYAQKDHYDHVHVAMQQGGRLDKPTVTLAGEDAPAFSEFFISTNPRFRKRSIALLSEAARRVGGRFEAFESGGIRKGRKGIARLDAQIEKGEREYSRMDARFNLSDEEFVTEDKDGNPVLNIEAIKKRAGDPESTGYEGGSELEQLWRKRRAIKKKMVALKKAIEKARKVLKRVIGNLRDALPKKITNKNRARADRLKDKIRDYTAERNELGSRLPGLTQDLLDQDVDSLGLQHEIAGIRGTKTDPSKTEDDSGTGTGTGTGDGITPEQQAILDNAQAMGARFNEIVASIGATNLGNRQLSLVASGAADMGTGNYRTAFGASAEGAFGQGLEPSFRDSPQIVIQTLHPGDPATLQAIGDAATAGMSLQGNVISPRVSVGI